MRYLTIITLLVYSNMVIAESCPKPVTFLSTGQASPCAGFLFSKEEELKVRQNKQELSLTNQKLDFQAKQIDTYKDQTQKLQDINLKITDESDIWRKSAIDSSKELIKVEEGRSTRDFIFLGGGFVAALISAWIVKQVR